MSIRIYPYLFLLFAWPLANHTNATEQATLVPASSAAAPYKEGQIVAENGTLYRKLLKITDKGYQVQNFYRANQQKQTDIFIIKNANNLSTFQPLELYNLQHLIFEGPLTLWFTNGTKHMSMQVNNSNAEGIFYSYHPNGVQEILGQYTKGKPAGLWFYWNQEGALEKKVYYKAGIMQWQKKSFTIKGF